MARRGRGLIGQLVVLAVLVGLLMVVRWLFPAENNGDRCTARLPFPGTTFEGRVGHVGDGDMLCVEAADGELIEVRLADFDAPELRQPGGGEARSTLNRVAMGKTARCRAHHTSHDRIVARCTIGGRPVGTLMREAGAPEGGN